MRLERKWYALMALLCGHILTIILSIENPFFWDGLYNAHCALHFYENGFNNLIVPQGFDAGHPPFFATYLALGWSVFGKSLVVSHLLYAPIVISFGFFSFLLFEKLIPSKLLPVACLLLFLEPTLLTQSTIIHQDLLLASLYMISCWLILKKRNWWLIVPMAIMPLLSLRGAVMVAALGLTHLLIHGNLKSLFKAATITPYLISLSLFLLWGVHHYQETGWAYFTTTPGYSDSRGFNSIDGIFRNCIVIIRNLMDCGRLLITLALITGVFINLKKIKHHRTELILFLIPTLLLSLSFIPFRNPIAHRYYLVSYTLAIPLIILLFKSTKLKYWVPVFVACGFIGGHFIIYPNTFSQGWDSNLSHLPYFDLRKDLDQHLFKQNIPSSEVSATFPLKYPASVRKLEGSEVFLQNIDLDSSNYILESNIANDFNTPEFEQLEKHYTLVYKSESHGIYLNLYERK